MARHVLTNLATIAAPLTTLSSARRKFVWTSAAEQAMKALQQLVQTAPPLLHWNPDLPTRVTTDASDVGLGAVLEQLSKDRWKPVEFWSRKLKPAETRYSATDKEWLAVVDAVSTHWRHLLEGKPCIIRTDHKPLLGNSPRQPPTLLFFHATLGGLNDCRCSLKFQHLSGSQNTIADALSRTPEYYVDVTQMDPPSPLLEQLQRAAAQDAHYQARLQSFQRDQHEPNPKNRDFTIQKRTYLPPKQRV